MSKKEQLNKSKKKGSKDNKAENVETKLLPKNNKRHYIINTVIKIIIYILSISGLFTFWWALSPHISVFPVSLINEYNPAYIPFIIKNENEFFSIRDVEIICLIKELTTTTGSLTAASENYNVIWRGLKRIDSICPHEQATEILPLTIIKTLDRIDHGDIAIMVKFSYLMLDNWEKKFRFVVFTDQKGNKYWVPKPIKQ